MGGLNCCKKPEEELVVDTIEAIDTNIEKVITNVKDRYPHDSDPAFRNLKYPELNGEFKTVSNIEELDQENNNIQ